MSGFVSTIDGTAAVPAYQINDPTTGMYRVGPGEMGFSVTGKKAASFKSTTGAGSYGEMRISDYAGTVDDGWTWRVARHPGPPYGVDIPIMSVPTVIRHGYYFTAEASVWQAGVGTFIATRRVAVVHDALGVVNLVGPIQTPCPDMGSGVAGGTFALNFVVGAGGVGPDIVLTFTNDGNPCKGAFRLGFMTAPF